MHSPISYSGDVVIESSSEAGKKYHANRGYNIVRITLGIVLISAGMLKSFGPLPGFMAWADQFAASWLLLGLVAFEVFFGLWLLFGLYSQQTRYFAIGCFLALSCISLWMALSGATSCGCFGRVAVNPWVTMVFDITAVVALWMFKIPAEPLLTIRTRPLRNDGIILSTILVAIAYFVSVLLFAPGSLPGNGELIGRGGTIVLDPQSWVGTCCPLLSYIDIGNRITKGRVIIVLFHNDCQECRQKISIYERWAREQSIQTDGIRIALIEMPPYANSKDRIVRPGSPCILGKLDESVDWFARTPMEIPLRDCIVLHR